MTKLFFFGAFVLLLTSCNQKQAKAMGADTFTFEISAENWPKKTNIDYKAMAILKDWPEYNAMEASFDALYKVENTEDLKLVIEDLIAKQKLLEDSEYPELFDIPQIKSRQKVFKTYFLKVKGDLEYRIGTEASTLEMINAFNALRNQFNIVVSNTLDTELILLDE